jgi:hypothetical protein
MRSLSTTMFLRLLDVLYSVTVAGMGDAGVGGVSRICCWVWEERAEKQRAARESHPQTWMEYTQAHTPAPGPSRGPQPPNRHARVHTHPHTQPQTHTRIHTCTECLSMCVCVCVRERERERQTDRQRERDRERERERERCSTSINRRCRIVQTTWHLRSHWRRRQS